MRSIVIAVACVLVASSVIAATIHVPADQPTIQAGINAASNGDTVLVAPGLYVENVSFLGKGVLLESSDGPAATILQPLNDTLPIVSFPSTNDSTAVIDGFTVQGTANASGIFSYLSRPTIRHCVVTDCHRKGDGGGIYATHTRVFDCLVYGNSSTNSGGGICGGDGIVEGNIVRNNISLLGCGISMGEGTVSRNFVYDNVDTGGYSGGIVVWMGITVVSNNTVVRNSHGIVFLDAGSSYLQINSNIVCGNAGHGILNKAPNSCIPMFNDVWNNGKPDTGFVWQEINVDPLFTNATASDFSLGAESPCIDRGQPDTAFNDPDGSRNDIGAYACSHVQPAAANVNLGSEFAERVVSHTPTFYWSYHDTVSSTQQGFEIQVSDSLVPFTANKWSPGSRTSSDTSILYAGSQLADGQTYYLRIRLNDGVKWGSWSYSHFRMNVLPGVPAPKNPINDHTAFAGAVQLVVDSAYNPDSDTMRYDFQLFSVNNPSELPAQELDLQNNVYSRYFTGLQTSTRYWWRARAYDGYERSGWSGLASFMTRYNTVIRVPADFAKIQDAITAASTHDTVLVAPGTYTGDGNRDLRFIEKSVFLFSSGGAQVTTIDCQGSASAYHRAIYLPAWRDTALVRGLTFQNGYADTGGAVFGRSATATFTDCVFRNNHATNGGAVDLIGSNFVNCIFHHNTADMFGGAVHCVRGPFVRCTFHSNTAYYGGAGSGSGAMDSCIIYGNSAQIGSALHDDYGLASYSLFARNGATGDGPCLDDVDGPFANCTFYGNLSLVDLSPQASPDFTNCLFAYNKGILFYCWSWGYGGPPPATPRLDHCAIYASGSGGCVSNQIGLRGNTAVDPGICDTNGLNFSLASNSHCIGSGTGGDNVGAFGAGCGPMGVNEPKEPLPRAFHLCQNYPNPFNPTTVISFDLPTRADVRLNIYDVLGRRVRELVDEDMPAGSHQVLWDGKSNLGRTVASGIYLYRLQAGDFVETKKMVLLK